LGNITDFGRKQQFELGQYVREKYIDKLGFLSDVYDQSEVYYQATFKQRTYVSALYQAMGMYPESKP
jgi:hypothetical protein